MDTYPKNCGRGAGLHPLADFQLAGFCGSYRLIRLRHRGRL